MGDDEELLLYNETMSLACQFGRCDDCPENGTVIDACSCTHHIPDDTDEAADAMAEALVRELLRDGEAMNGSQIFQLCSAIFMICGLTVAGFCIVRAGFYIKITGKLRAGETLSARERRMLDRVKS